MSLVHGTLRTVPFVEDVILLTQDPHIGEAKSFWAEGRLACGQRCLVWHSRKYVAPGHIITTDLRMMPRGTDRYWAAWGQPRSYAARTAVTRTQLGNEHCHYLSQEWNKHRAHQEKDDYQYGY